MQQKTTWQYTTSEEAELLSNVSKCLKWKQQIRDATPFKQLLSSFFFFCCLISLKSKEEWEKTIDRGGNASAVSKRQTGSDQRTEGELISTNFHTKGQMTDEKYFRDGLKMPPLRSQGDDCRVQSVLQSRTLWNRIACMSTFCWVGCKQISVKLNSPHPAWPTSSTRLVFFKNDTHQVFKNRLFITCNLQLTVQHTLQAKAFKQTNKDWGEADKFKVEKTSSS